MKGSWGREEAERDRETERQRERQRETHTQTQTQTSYWLPLFLSDQVVSVTSDARSSGSSSTCSFGCGAASLVLFSLALNFASRAIVSLSRPPFLRAGRDRPLWTERQRDRETERQRDRETETETERDRERNCVCVCVCVCVFVSTDDKTLSWAFAAKHKSVSSHQSKRGKGGEENRHTSAVALHARGRETCWPLTQALLPPVLPALLCLPLLCLIVAARFSVLQPPARRK